MHITKILDFIKEGKYNLNEMEIVQNEKKIQSIINICDKHFKEKFTNGNSALNRSILLHPKIATWLDSSVIQYLFSTKKSFLVARDDKQPYELRDVIYYGFAEGLEVVKLMLNNNTHYDQNLYNSQKQKFNNNTLRIVENILHAAHFTPQQRVGFMQENTEQTTAIMNVENLKNRLKHIIEIITQIKLRTRADELITVEGFEPEDIRSENQEAFAFIDEALKDEDNSDLYEFCDNFLLNDELWFNASVSHSLLDRVHLEAALERTKLYYKIGNDEFSYREVISQIVAMITENPLKYSEHIREQICIRLHLVEEDLKKRFTDIYNSVKTKESKIRDFARGTLKSQQKSTLQEIKGISNFQITEEFRPWLEEAFYSYFNNSYQLCNYTGSYILEDQNIIYRPNYGLAHAMKKVALVPHIFKIFFPFVHPNDINYIRKALLFSHTGYQESLEKNSELIDQRSLSAINFETYALDKIPKLQLDACIWAISHMGEELTHENYLFTLFLYTVNICMALIQEDAHYLKKTANLLNINTDKIHNLQNLNAYISKYIGWGKGENLADPELFYQASTVMNHYYPDGKFSKFFTISLDYFLTVPIYLSMTHNKKNNRTILVNGISFDILECLKHEGLNFYDRSENDINNQLYRFMADKLKVYPNFLIHRPRNKNYATLELEKILNSLVSSHRGLPTLIEDTIIHLGQNIYSFNNQIYNVNELLDEVNYEDIHLTPAHFKFFLRLNKYLKSMDYRVPKKFTLPDFENDLFFSNLGLPTTWDDLFISINYKILLQYMDDMSCMQDFLRDPSSVAEDTLFLVYKIFQSIMLAKLLHQPARKLMDSNQSINSKETRQVQYRIESLESKEIKFIVNRRKECLRKNIPLKQYGLTSTSISFNSIINFFNNRLTDEDNLITYEHKNRIVTILLQDAKNSVGKRLKFSNYMVEKENLIPHGIYLQYFYYTQINSLQIFFAKIVDPLQKEIYNFEREAKLRENFRFSQLHAQNQLLYIIYKEPRKTGIKYMDDAEYFFGAYNTLLPAQKNILHILAEKGYTPENCWDGFYVKAFFHLLIQKNIFNITPLEYFLKIEKFSLLSENNIYGQWPLKWDESRLSFQQELISWFNERIKFISSTKIRSEFLSLVKDLLFSAIDRGILPLVLLLTKFKLDFSPNKENPLHRSIHMWEKQPGEVRKRICTDLTRIYPKLAYYSDEKGFVPCLFNLSGLNIAHHLPDYYLENKSLNKLNILTENSRKRPLEKPQKSRDSDCFRLKTRK